MAAWHEEWEQVCTLRLQALEQGHPYPPVTLPYLELQPFLPEGLPEDFPPSIDRCAACQNRLEEVSLLAGWQVAGTEAGRLQGRGGASAAGVMGGSQRHQRGKAAQSSVTRCWVASCSNAAAAPPLLFTPTAPLRRQAHAGPFTASLASAVPLPGTGPPDGS